MAGEATARSATSKIMFMLGLMEMISPARACQGALEGAGSGVGVRWGKGRCEHQVMHG